MSIRILFSFYDYRFTWYLALKNSILSVQGQKDLRSKTGLPFHSSGKSWDSLICLAPNLLTCQRGKALLFTCWGCFCIKIETSRKTLSSKVGIYILLTGTLVVKDQFKSYNRSSDHHISVMVWCEKQRFFPQASLLKCKITFLYR